MPHAKLQPSAPTSMVRTSSRPASATLNEQVKVRSMISANRISEIAVKHLLLLPPAPQCVVELHHCQPLIELSLGQAELGVEVTRIAVEDFEVTRHSTLVAHIS